MQRGWVAGSLLAALAAAAVSVGAAADEAGGTVTEDATGVAFPVTRRVPGSDAALALTGTGVRKRLVFKVYALGFYVDPETVRRELSGFKGKTAEALAGDPAAYRALVALGGTRAAVLHFVREVSADKMQAAMTEAMDRGVDQGDPARKDFLALWKDTLRSGEEVVLVFGGDGSVSLVRGGAVVGTVPSAPLSRALLEAWLGPDPVSDDIQAGVVERLPGLL